MIRARNASSLQVEMLKGDLASHVRMRTALRLAGLSGLLAKSRAPRIVNNTCLVSRPTFHL